MPTVDGHTVPDAPKVKLPDDLHPGNSLTMHGWLMSGEPDPVDRRPYVSAWRVHVTRVTKNLVWVRVIGAMSSVCFRRSDGQMHIPQDSWEAAEPGTRWLTVRTD